MATIKEATQNGIEFAKDTLGQLRTLDIRLEEVDSATMDGKDSWLITLSMIETNDFNKAVATFQSALGSSGKREYKIFNVLKETGEVSAMKIREFATM